MIHAPPLQSGALEADRGFDLRARYAAYRLREARALAAMLPTEAVRPLYRRASELFTAGAGAVSTAPGGPVTATRTTAKSGPGGSTVDPMAVLVSYCESILPLPPFEVWLRDLEEHPDEHLGALERSAVVPTATEPDTLEERTFDCDRGRWVARLRGFRDGDAWRGFIAFRSSGNDVLHRTSLIFRESRAADLRERFLTFESATLAAFLRSSLP